MKEYEYRVNTVFAVKFDGDTESEDLAILMGARIGLFNYVTSDTAVLCTKDGPKVVNIGDYVVRLPNGEFRAYTPESFRIEFRQVR